MRPETKGFRPKRRFGQNFLINQGAADGIVQAFSPRLDDRVIEIGPGQGVLTRRLAGRVGRLLAIEVDRSLAARLSLSLGRPGPDLPASGAAAPAAPGPVEVVEADVLSRDLGEWLDLLGASTERPARLIGNLPFNIATAIVLRSLSLRPRLRDLMVMVQREVAERILSPPGRKSYGGLSVLCRTYARCDSILRLGPGSFRPRPKVQSQVVRLTLRDPGGRAGADPEGFALFLRRAFRARRKTLLNALSADFPGGADAARALIAAAGLDPRCRAEELGPDRLALLFESAP